MSYSSIGSLRTWLDASKRLAAAPAASASGRIATPNGTLVTGVSTPSAPTDGQKASKLVKWGIPIALVAVGGFFYLRARKKRSSGGAG